MEKNNANYDSDERMVYAFLLAPIPVLLLMWCLTALSYMLGGFNPWGIVLGFYIFIVGLFFAYAIELVIALPLFYGLRKLGIENMWVTIFLASLLAGSLYLVFDLLSLSPLSSGSSFGDGDILRDNVHTPYGYRLLLRATLFMMALGAVSGLTFWKVYRRGYGK